MMQVTRVIVACGFVLGLVSAASAVTIHSGTFTDPVGLVYGTYISGSEGGGYTPDPSNYGYNYDGGNPSYGNARDYRWLHDIGSANPADPVTGIWWDLGGLANKLVVFPIIDHDPVPQEAFEYDVFLSDDTVNWHEATLTDLYDEGWDPDPAIADGWTTVWSLGVGEKFRYASVAWGNPGNPDPSYLYGDGDSEIDAVAGLTEEGGPVHPVPEPGAFALLGLGLIPLALVLRRRFV